MALSIAVPADLEGFFSSFQSRISQSFGWFYILSMNGFLLFGLFLIGSRYGSIKLGKDEDQPEFSRFTWFSMLFSAGMGIGLLFYGVSEPVLHYASPPVGNGENLEAARNALGLTFFHWGLHPWAVYAIVGLSLAYFGHRKGLPFTIRSAFYPILGERVYGIAGNIIDTIAIVSTLFGVATSLGVGAMQVNAGLNFLFSIEESYLSQLLIISSITLFATISVVTGLKKGIRILSELNISLAIVLMLFVAISGPTFFLLNSFVQNLGVYLQQLPKHSFWTATFASDQSQSWLSDWTVFYWAWWISWSPFVGMFIARVSKGRTLREFMLAVFIAPTIAGFVWMTVFGNTALHFEIIQGVDVVGAVSSSVPKALYFLLGELPFPEITGAIATICVILFFITSSDSASLVIDTISSGGSENPPVWQRIYWAFLEGVVAATLLMVGGLAALQTAAITTALPFCLVIILICIGLSRSLKEEVVGTSLQKF